MSVANLIVGSGPSALAVANDLLTVGERVVLLETPTCKPFLRVETEQLGAGTAGIAAKLRETYQRAARRRARELLEAVLAKSYRNSTVLASDESTDESASGRRYARELLTRLRGRNGFEHVPNAFAFDFREVEGLVELQYVDTLRGSSETRRGARLFVAADPIHSTVLVAKASGLYRGKFVLRESQRFVVPMIATHRFEPPASRADLRCVSLELLDSRVSPQPVSLQLYKLGDLLRTRRAGAPADGWIDRVLNRLADRLWIAVAHLDSADSDSIALEASERSGPNVRVRLVACRSRRVMETVRGALSVLNQHTPFRGLYLSRIAALSAPGETQRLAGGFPMSPNRREMATDALGRPYGFANVHVVDASVLTSVGSLPLEDVEVQNARRIVRALLQMTHPALTSARRRTIAAPTSHSRRLRPPSARRAGRGARWHGTTDRP